MNRVQIGEGGSSRVFRVWYEKAGGFAAEKRSRHPLAWEAVWLKKLQGFAVPAFYEIRQENGFWVLVMEYVHGRTLEEMICEKAIPAEQLFVIAENLIAEILRIQCAYPELVFCDLKPANVIVNQKNQITLIDFDSVARAGIKKICKGTRPYAAPEIFQGIPGRKSDIYSIAHILWRINEKQIDLFFLRVIVPCIRQDVSRRQGNLEWLAKKVRMHRLKLHILRIMGIYARKLALVLAVFFVLCIVMWLLEKNHDIIKFTRAVRDCLINY